MVKYSDGEFRDDTLSNDYSDVSTDSKMKFYWLFDFQSSIILTLIGTALIEIIMFPSDTVRKIVRLCLFGTLLGYRIFLILVLNYKAPFA